MVVKKIAHENNIVMLYRAQDEQKTSRLGYAESMDGVHFTVAISLFSVRRRITTETAASKIRGWFNSGTLTI